MFCDECSWSVWLLKSILSDNPKIFKQDLETFMVD